MLALKVLACLALASGLTDPAQASELSVKRLIKSSQDKIKAAPPMSRRALLLTIQEELIQASDALAATAAASSKRERGTLNSLVAYLDTFSLQDAKPFDAARCLATKTAVIQAAAPDEEKLSDLPGEAREALIFLDFLCR